MIAQGYIFSALYVALCLTVSALLYKLGAPKRITRKVLHVLVGGVWFILYHTVGVSWHFFAVCLIFLILLIIEFKCKLFPTMSSDGDNAPGTVYYAVAMSALALVTMLLPKMIFPFGIGVLCTSLGDGAAGLAGSSAKKHNPQILGSKTLVGTASGFAVSFAAVLAFSAIYSLWLDWWHCLAIAAFSAVLELIFGKGFDNVGVALGTAALSYMILYHSEIAGILLPIIFTPLIIVLAYSKKILSKTAIVGALLLDLSVSAVFGNFGFLMLSAFLFGSVAVDKVKRRSAAHSHLNKKSERECRNLLQVFSNGFAAMLSALLFALTSHAVFVITFSASLAEAFSDTCASGIGVFAKRTYDPFRRKTCETGISGGMSWLGTLASLLAAAVISVIPLACVRLSVLEAAIVTSAAFIGAFADSMMGSLVQVKYKCQICGKITETHKHCGKDTVRYSGCSVIDNNAVNLISTFVACFVAAALYLLV